ncbi:MAG: hypothetical protein HeimC2_00410 [Candidatus Heimdallarchaeota archaeon LC_2]|nr:MAG: hypothetical protein HeimC2_00410 [Candidatus Heimdallarchaeota archaeon LC_2]
MEKETHINRRYLYEPLKRVEGQKSIIFSSIGLPVPNKRDPILQIVKLYPPVKIFAIGSQEDPKEEKPTFEDNLVKIGDILEQTMDDIPEIIPCKFHLNDYDNTVLELSKMILEQYIENPTYPFIFDLTGGRRTLSVTLHQSALLAHNLLYNLDKYKEEKISLTKRPNFWITTKGKDSEIITIELRVPEIPILPIMNLIRYQISNPNATQEEVSEKMGRHQTTIGRWFSDLRFGGWLGENGTTTPLGIQLYQLMLTLDKVQI